MKSRVITLISTLSTEYGGPVTTALASAKVLQESEVNHLLVALDGWVSNGCQHRYVGRLKVIKILINYCKAARQENSISVYLIVRGIFQLQSLLAFFLAKTSLITGYSVFLHGALTKWFSQNDNCTKRLKKKIYFYVAERRILASASKILCTSLQEKQDLERIWNIRFDSVAIVKYGILPSLPIDRSKKRFDKKYILYMGRLARKKNIENMVDAFLASGLVKSLDFLIAGDVRGEYASALVEKYSKCQGVQFLGHLTDKNKADVMSNAWMGFFVSLDENFGVFGVECLSYGIPVLISHHVGFAEGLEQYKALCFSGVETGEITVSLQAFCQLLEEDRENIAGQAFSIFQEKFNLKKIMRDDLGDWIPDIR